MAVKVSVALRSRSHLQDLESDGRRGREAVRIQESGLNIGAFGIGSKGKQAYNIILAIGRYKLSGLDATGYLNQSSPLARTTASDKSRSEATRKKHNTPAPLIVSINSVFRLLAHHDRYRYTEPFSSCHIQQSSHPAPSRPPSTTCHRCKMASRNVSSTPSLWLTNDTSAIHGFNK